MTTSRRDLAGVGLTDAADAASAVATDTATVRPGSASFGDPPPAPGEAAAGRGVYVPGRWIPAPTTISNHAQAFLANPPDMSQVYAQQNDASSDPTAGDNFGPDLSVVLAYNAEVHPAEVITHRLSAAVNYELVPASLAPENAHKVIYYIHGGGFYSGGGMAAAYMAMPMADAARTRTFSVDYRMPPSNPFPAGLNDVVEGYRALLAQYRPENIAIAGGSAGGGLGASLVLKIRDLGLPMPGCCALFTPEADLTESGDTFATNDTVDVILRHRFGPMLRRYANGHDLSDPYLSPIYGDFSRGFPPTILVSGTRDLFLSNTVLLHRALRKAGLKAELHVFEAMPHAGFFGAPEDQEVMAEQVRFIHENLGARR
jgi:acetyl esterase/lipase